MGAVEGSTVPLLSMKMWLIGGAGMPLARTSFLQLVQKLALIAPIGLIKQARCFFNKTSFIAYISQLRLFWRALLLAKGWDLFLQPAKTAMYVAVANARTAARRVISGISGKGDGEAVGSSEANGVGVGFEEGEGVGVAITVGAGVGLDEETDDEATNKAVSTGLISG